jgi:peptide methionine sulfoxide reductase MsrA
MEELIRKQPGVLNTRVGYTGGDIQSPTVSYLNNFIPQKNIIKIICKKIQAAILVILYILIAI